MFLAITEITDEEFTFSNGERTVVLPALEIDRMSYLQVGTEIEFGETDETPYKISRARRQDIRDHHAEEAACGNI